MKASCFSHNNNVKSLLEITVLFKLPIIVVGKNVCTDFDSTFSNIMSIRSCEI